MCMRGKSVIDYVHIPHNNYDTIENFQVEKYNDIIDTDLAVTDCWKEEEEYQTMVSYPSK